jgi:phosphatidylserine/phosphatidylglycerophosphate/cardiolipin synthase-like enzyme
MKYFVFLLICFSAHCSMTVSFSPQDGYAKDLIKCIRSEKKSISMAIYWIDLKEVIHALIDAKNRGVAVEIIVDPVTFESPHYKPLSEANIPIYVWDSTLLNHKKHWTKPVMHNKFCIFGSKTVWTGSANFTAAANYANAENIIVFTDLKVAKEFQKEFDRLKNYLCRTLEEYFKAQE